MKKVIIAGITYLGTLTEKGGVAVLTKAFNCGGSFISQRAFPGYLKAENLGDLEAIEFGGKGTNYSISSLTKSEKLEFKVCKLNMKRAKATALSIAENQVMDGLLGK